MSCAIIYNAPLFRVMQLYTVLHCFVVVAAELKILILSSCQIIGMSFELCVSISCWRYCPPIVWNMLGMQGPTTRRRHQSCAQFELGKDEGYRGTRI